MSFARFCACYIDKNLVSNPFEFTVNVLDLFKRKILEVNKYINLAQNYIDVINNRAENKISTFLSIEGGEALEGNIENLDFFYRKGVRMMSFTWNYENELGYGVMEEKESKPLKSFGLSVLKKMQELNKKLPVAKSGTI